MDQMSTYFKGPKTWAWAAVPQTPFQIPVVPQFFVNQAKKAGKVGLWVNICESGLLCKSWKELVRCTLPIGTTFPNLQICHVFFFVENFVETQDLAMDWLYNAWIVWCFYCEFLLEKISPKKLGFSGQKLSKVADLESFPNATNCALQVSRGMDSSIFSSCHHEDKSALNVILKFPLTILTATSLNSGFSLDVKFHEREALV